MTKQIFFGTVFFVLSMLTLGSAAYVYSQNSENYRNIPIVSSIGVLPGVDQTPTPPKDDFLSILLLGVGGEGHDGGSLTDTIMVAQIDSVEKRIRLVSLPRDLLVFEEDGIYQKINAVYTNAREDGLEVDESIRELAEDVERITGIEIDHYARVDFLGFEQIVDAVDGVEITIDESIDDPFYPGPNYSYDPFEIDAGTQVLDGETALKYARTRYTSENGDFDRASRQQQVVAQIKDEILGLNPVWDIQTVISLIRIFSETVDTDLSIGRMRDLYDTYNDIDSYELDTVVVGEDLLRGSLEEGYRMFGRTRGYVIVPRAGDENYLQTREEVRNSDIIDEYREEHQAIFNFQPHSLEIVTSESQTDLVDLRDLLISKGYRVTFSSPSPTEIEVQSSENLLVVPPKDVEYDENGDSLRPAEEQYIIREFDASKQVDEDATVMTLYLNDLPEWFEEYVLETL